MIPHKMEIRQLKDKNLNINAKNNQPKQERQEFYDQPTLDGIKLIA